MRSYWIKIFAGAAVIFGVGMVIASLARQVHREVHYVTNSSGPIKVPLFFVPFQLDQKRVGTVRGVTVFRDSLQQPTSLGVTIALADSVTPAAFATCIVALLPQGTDINPTRFTCLRQADTAGKQLARFGTLHLRSLGDSFSLYAPKDKIAEIRNSTTDRMSQEDSRQRAQNDSARSKLRGQIDSIMQAARDSSDAIRARAEAKTQSLRERMPNEQ